MVCATVNPRVIAPHCLPRITYHRTDARCIAITGGVLAHPTSHTERHIQKGASYMTVSPITLREGPYTVRNGQPAPARPADPSARENTITARILAAHHDGGAENSGHPGEPGPLRLRFDSLTSHDITYVGIIQTARASGLTEFPMPYVLTNCHNSLCAVGGTINEDDHRFALSAAKKYGGIYVPANLAVIHSYNREMMAGCGRMILGSDSHTRYGALGTMGVGEGGGELAKQLLGRRYDMPRPEVIAVVLRGRVRPGVGPQDVALAIISAVYGNGFVKNRVMEFIGEGVASLPVEYRNGIDVMTTETACWSSVWQTDARVQAYYAAHGREDAYREMTPGDVALYDGGIEVDLDRIEPMIALPFHPSNALPIAAFLRNAGDILRELEKECAQRFPGAPVKLTDKVRDGAFYVDQGIVAGCSGGTYDNLCVMANMLHGKSIGDGAFSLGVYPGSMPAYLALVKNGAAEKLCRAGAILRECFCGPCFGAGDTPASGAFSVRHTTRNFENREGSKPGEGQLSLVALMDARSIAATAANGGRLTSAMEMDADEGVPEYHFDPSPYEARVFGGFGRANADEPLVFGPNIKDWPDIPALKAHLLVKIASRLTDPVTTTDELIPSGETASYRSNPLRLAEFTLSRKDPGYVARAKAFPADGEVQAALRRVPEAAGADAVSVGTAVLAVMPGDGSAREQAASCQRVLGGVANLARAYATKRYRTNLINWGMLPFVTEADVPVGGYVYVPDIARAVRQGWGEIPAWALDDKGARQISLSLGETTAEEREILLAGCLMNYYRR